MADIGVQVVQISVDEWVDLKGTMQRFETKLDIALGKGDDHETRIRSLEKWRWRNTGFASAIGAGMALVGNFLIYHK